MADFLIGTGFAVLTVCFVISLLFGLGIFSEE